MSFGLEFEYRVAQVVFKQGYFSRRQIPLRSLFYPHNVDVTDIDVIGIKFDSSFNKSVTIWDCKTGKSHNQDKPVERIIWLLGVSSYVKADYKVLVRPQIDNFIKTFSNSLNVSTWTEKTLQSIEKTEKSNFHGANNFSVYFQRSKDNYQIIKDHDLLKRIYWYQKCNFWFDKPEFQLKKLISTIKDCHELLIIGDLNKYVAKELLMESIILLSLALLDFAKMTYPWINDNFKDRVEYLLRSGSINENERKELLKSTFYFIQELKQIDLSNNLDKFLNIPSPPYTNQLVNYLERIIEHSNIAIQVPRFLDVMIYDYILKNETLNQEELELFFRGDIILLAKMTKNLVTFVENCIDAKLEFFEPLSQF